MEEMTLNEKIDLILHSLINMATKEDIANMATKEDIANMATKEDIANMATKEDIANMATKEDIANMATKEDIANMATKEDIANMATKEDVFHIVGKAKAELYDEIIRAEKQSERIIERVDALESKVNTLLIQEDNTSIMLELYRNQATEIESMRTRIEDIEQKLA